MNPRTKWTTALAWAAIATIAALSQGCSTVSSHPTPEGTSDRIVFPRPDTAWPAAGTFPNADNLRLLAPGMTKDQLYALVGRPHFNEGMVAVREWDYLFNLRTGKAAPGEAAHVEQCQMKVLFDKDMLARTYVWSPERCASLAGPLASTAGTPVSEARPVTAAR